jgi:CheY-like chemotaxis protein
MPGSFMLCRIVVADDDLDSAESLAVLLEMDGHHVMRAHDGLRALELIRQFEPELALLDIGMPKLDGYEIARCVRDSAVGERVFLVATTGWGQPQDVQRSKEAGFNVHLVKPINPEAIKTICAQLEPRNNR